MRNFLAVTVLFLAACNSASVENSNDSAAIDSMAVMTDTTLPHPQSTVLDTIAPSATKEMIRWNDQEIHDLLETEIPEGWQLMDSMSGDLNRDQFVDLLVVLRNPADEDTGGMGNRRLLVFAGQKDQAPELVAQNDNVVLCKECGGIWGDPYEGLAIKNGYFSVEHYGGSSERWSKIITFKYNEEQKTWLLHRDGGVNYSVFEPDNETEYFDNQDQYGKLKFVEYDYN